MVPFWTDKNGVRHAGKGTLRRDAKAPFVPAHFVENEDDLAQFVEPFRRLSAVWHIRIGFNAKSIVIPNPNASIQSRKRLPSDYLTHRLIEVRCPREILATDLSRRPKQGRCS